jgi:polysaccharide pyruvyl transferase WcaK-like protein
MIDIGTPEQPTLSLTPKDWYHLIATSSGYIGVRFHPLIVAVAHDVPVFSLDQYARTPIQRKSSKSYLHLKSNQLSSFHSTKLGYRFLRPKQIVKALERQRKQKISNRTNLRDELDRMLSKINNIR